MLLVNGMTCSQKIVNISEVVPALTWMDTRPLQCVLRICVAKVPLLGRKWNNTHENDFNVWEILPRDGRTDNRMFLLQSCYGFGCPGAVT
jgi:hypothetical protein